MSTTHDGGPAFPTPCGYATVKDYHPGDGTVERTVEICTIGMSKREEFAKAALIGLLSNSYDGFYSDFTKLAEDAFKVADAMLKERQK